MSFNLQITKWVLNGLWPQQILCFLAFVEKPVPDHYLPPLRDQSGNRFSLVAAGWLSIFRTHCVTVCGREITPSPNPPRGRTTTTVTLRKEYYSNVDADGGEKVVHPRMTADEASLRRTATGCVWYPTLPGVSSAAPASACSSQAAGAPEHGSLSPWPLGCPTLDRDKHKDRETEFCSGVGLQGSQKAVKDTNTWVIGAGDKCYKRWRCPNAASNWVMTRQVEGRAEADERLQ